MRKPVRLGFSLVALLALVACDPAPNRLTIPAAPEAGVAFIGSSIAPPPPPPPGSERRIGHSASLASAPSPASDPDRKIVRT
ncbi:MAG TPA: hypothetical protein VF139_14365, partial [Candidatus Polarisedimenticolaceae bacterium]